MDKKFGLFILAGLFMGAAFGVFLGAALKNPLLGVWLGAAGGVFLGGFAAATVHSHK